MKLGERELVSIPEDGENPRIDIFRANDGSIRFNQETDMIDFTDSQLDKLKELLK